MFTLFCITYLSSAISQPCPAYSPNISSNSSTTFCYGDSIVLSVIDTFTSYYWAVYFAPNEGYSLSTTYNAVVGTEGEVQLIVTDANNCTFVSSVNTFYHPYTLPQIISNNDTIYCPGSSINTTLQLTDSYSSYLWNTGGTNSFIAATDTGNYSVTVTDYYGCNFTTSQSIRYFPQKHVEVGVVSGPFNVCSNEPFTTILKPTIIKPEECSDIWWNNGATTYYDTVHAAGEYFVTIIDTNGCEFSSIPHFFIIAFQTNPVITQHGDSLFLTPTSLITQWYLNDTLIPGAVEPKIKPVVSGNYKASVTTNLPCTFFSDNYYFTSSGFTEVDKPPVAVYPNPANSNINFTAVNEYDLATLKIYEPTGKLVFETIMSNFLTVNTTHWKQGIYFFSATTNKLNYSGKIIISH